MNRANRTIRKISVGVQILAAVGVIIICLFQFNSEFFYSQLFAWLSFIFFVLYQLERKINSSLKQKLRQ